MAITTLGITIQKKKKGITIHTKYIKFELQAPDNDFRHPAVG